MASTNKTTHYNLSQYVGTDKPTYLVDYNTDMSNIDTGIYDAQAKANVNESSIGTLSNLTTDSKSDLVSAINEVDSHCDTNTNNITNMTSDITTNTNAIGVLTNLTTTAKTDLVSAVNEVDSIATTNTTNIGTLSSLTTTDKTSVVDAINEVNTKANTIGDLSSLTTTDKTTVVDAINEINGKASLHNYSTTEQVVGTYIDGKPLYEKTVSSTTTAGGTKQVLIDSNLKLGWIQSGCIISDDNGAFIPLEYYSSSSLFVKTRIQTNGNLALTTGSSSSAINGSFIATVRYTKTTD